MSEQTIFGTDGIRGRAGEGWLTNGAVAALGRSAGRALASGSGSARALLGHDGRESGPELEAAFASGLADAGVSASSVGLISTPGLAWLTRNGHFELGCMISASHNPSEDNGIKLFSSEGDKLSDELQDQIEDALRNEPQTDPPAAPIAHDPDYENAYLEHLVTGIAAGLELDGFTLALDCANGSGSRVAPRTFAQLGAEVISIAADPNGVNINEGCGSTHPEALQQLVRDRGAQVGVALDGDGDRCILVDEHGELVHGDGIMTVVARHAMQTGRYTDPRIVATVMSNRGLHRAMREVGVGVVEVAVGDRAVVEALRREKLGLGGEQSGHIIFGDENAYIGDGVVTALRVLQVMAETGRPLSELAAAYQPFPQVLVNVRVARKPALEEMPDVLAHVASIENEMGEDGRVLLRYSGTEPLARVMVEGPDEGEIQRYAQELAQRIESELGE